MSFLTLRELYSHRVFPAAWQTPLRVRWLPYTDGTDIAEQILSPIVSIATQSQNGPPSSGQLKD